MKKIINLISILLICFLLNSCASYTSVPIQSITVSSGVIASEGVEIIAQDGSFHLKSGEIWSPPFQNTTNGYGMHDSNAKMIDYYPQALSMGARRVKVKTPYLNKDLYGILLLSKIYTGCSSAVTRSYQISIPNSYVEKALNGKISVLYEYYTACGSLIGDNPQGKTWVLWLSDVPFR